MLCTAMPPRSSTARSSGSLPGSIECEVQRLTEQGRAADARLSAHEVHRLTGRIGVDRDRAAA